MSTYTVYLISSIHISALIRRFACHARPCWTEGSAIDAESTSFILLRITWFHIRQLGSWEQIHPGN